MLSLALVLQTPSAFAQVDRSLVGEWAGTLDGNFRGYDDGAFGDFERHAELAFTVEDDGTIHGFGAGWERYSSIGGCIQGNADYVEFDISGYVDGSQAVIAFDNVTPDLYPTVDCGGYRDSFKMHPFGIWRSYFAIELRDGAAFDSGAGAKELSGYPAPGGADVLAIGGGGGTAYCPPLTLTPTMPPASDPRVTASLTDTVSYRMQVAWEGAVPVRVNFDVEGGGETVRPSFVFNPANMQSSPISVLMDVQTMNAEKGQYPIAVQARVVDPDTGEECLSNTADFILDVGAESQDIVFTKRDGTVNVVAEGEATVVETGGDGAAGFAFGNEESATGTTTIDVGADTAIKQEKLDYVEKLLADKARTAEELAWTDNDLINYKEPGAWERIKDSVQEFVDSTALSAAAADANLYSCLFAFDANAAEICSGESAVYVSRGDLHLDHTSPSGEAIDRVNEPDKVSMWDRLRVLLTPTAVIVPNGTEMTVNVEQSAGSSVTTVTMLEGSAVVIDLITEEVRLVQAGEAYRMDASFADTASASNSVESVNPDSMTRWWSTDEEIERLLQDEGFITAVAVGVVAVFVGIVAAIGVVIYLIVRRIRKRKQAGTG